MLNRIIHLKITEIQVILKFTYCVHSGLCGTLASLQSLKLFRIHVFEITVIIAKLFLANIMRSYNSRDSNVRAVRIEAATNMLNY